MKYKIAKTTALVVAAATLAACDDAGSRAEITAPPQPVTYFSAATQERASGQNTVTVRTRAVAEVDGKEKSSEIVGVRCNILGNGFQASIVTPAKVEVPVFLGATDPLLASCTHNGQDAQTTLNANRIQTKAVAPLSTGLAGIVVIAVANAAIDANRNPANDRFTYPNRMNVDFPATITAE